MVSGEVSLRKFEDLTKEAIAEMQVTLDNLVAILSVLFEIADEAKGKDLVVCIGNTGSGKSTLLTSLLYGPEALTIENYKV